MFLISKFKNVIFGPRLLRSFKLDPATNRKILLQDYEVNNLEWLGESFIYTVSFALSAAYYCAPLVVYYLYSKEFTNDQIVYYLKVIGFICFGFTLSYLSRGCGRYQNENYMKFFDDLSRANENKNLRERLQFYDFEFFAWPVDFSWKESTIKSSIKWNSDAYDGNDRSKETFIFKFLYAPIRILQYCVAHALARPMAFPGSVKLLQAAMSPMLTQGRTGLIEKNGLRSKLLSCDGNEIDSMFIDKRNDNHEANGNYLVITCEGNAAFYESGIMGTPLKAGYSVLGWNHPGFLGSTGQPFPDQERNAVDVVVQYAVTRLGFTIDNITLFAWSIGGYTATYACMMYPDIKALILDATFDDVNSLAVARMPTFASGFVRNVINSYMDLNNARNIVKYHGPILLIRRQREEIITTVPLDPATNRGNFLLIKLLCFRYPKVISKESLTVLVNYLSAPSEIERASILESIGGINEEACERTLTLNSKHNLFPLEIGNELTEKKKIELTLFLAIKYMIHYDASHCVALPYSYFTLPWQHGT